jgi:hypothetical protein
MFKMFYKFVLIQGLLLLFGFSSSAVNVRNFGATGNGVTDDTEAIINALKSVDDGVLMFPAGTYKISRTIEIQLADTRPISVTGNGGSAVVVMHASGPAIRFAGTHENGSALPATLSESVWNRERMPLIEAIEIRGAHPQANGIEFRHTFQPTIRGVLIRKVHHGLHFTSRNRNVLVESSHIYHCSGIGIFLDEVNIHQMNIGNSHISYCREGGIKVTKSEIRNFQITGNDIEYNCDPQAGPVADIWIDVKDGGSVREGTITGNTIQAIQSPGGANIRFTGLKGNPDKIGLWSITGNHISNQEINIDLQSSRGISITGNTFIRAYDRHLVMNDSKNILVSTNVFDHNPDYFTQDVVAAGGIMIQRSEQILLSQNILEGMAYGTAEQGGAVVVSKSSAVDILDLQINNPKYRGIEIEGCSEVTVSRCRIRAGDSESFVAGIALKSNNIRYQVRNNIITGGGQGITGISKKELKYNTIER